MLVNATSPWGLSVSPIRCEQRKYGSMHVEEFSIGVRSAYGGSRVLRYQLDARGDAGWHLYEEGEGSREPSLKPMGRDSYGSLRPGFSLDELDCLWRVVIDSPQVATYFLIAIGTMDPKYFDPLDPVKFIYVPIAWSALANLRTFDSIVLHYGQGDRAALTQARHALAFGGRIVPGKAVPFWEKIMGKENFGVTSGTEDIVGPDTIAECPKTPIFLERRINIPMTFVLDEEGVVLAQLTSLAKMIDICEKRGLAARQALIASEREMAMDKAAPSQRGGFDYSPRSPLMKGR
jgi:hypothetical protein